MARSHYIYIVKFVDGTLSAFTVKWELGAYLDSVERNTRTVQSIFRHRDGGVYGADESVPVDITEEFL